MMKNILFFIPILLCSGMASAQQNVLLLPTIHKLHTENERYNYDSLRTIIAAYQPATIAVEIRKEDLGCDTEYLKRNYPREMWMMSYWFPNVKIAGFDWLGKDIEGKRIPDNYWREQSEIKKWERALEADTKWSHLITPCNNLTQQRMRVLKTCTLNELLNSNDAALTTSYYSCLNRKLSGSVHHRVVEFYNARNERMIANLKGIIKERREKEKLLILTGDDHYPALKQGLQLK
ncbi:MAG: hypothetical protein JST70_01345 [Bacteroidetes bacterium]|nr:hypothetical protein [Bacteroidota bacterium]